jgi:hypothetical protein
MAAMKMRDSAERRVLTIEIVQQTEGVMTKNSSVLFGEPGALPFYHRA